jgi:hypothetical protein
MNASNTPRSAAPIPMDKTLHPLLESLQGGDRRSIGKSNDVVKRLLHDPALFDVLISGMLLHDPLIRMRCADAAEKVTAIHPEYLVAYKPLLLNTLAKVEQPEVQWHVAPMLARLPLSAAEQKAVIDILLAQMNSRSSIVKTFATQALFDLAKRYPRLQPLALRHIQELTVSGTPAMKARGRKLLTRLLRPPPTGRIAPRLRSEPRRHE